MSSQPTAGNADRGEVTTYDQPLLHTLPHGFFLGQPRSNSRFRYVRHLNRSHMRVEILGKFVSATGDKPAETSHRWVTTIETVTSSAATLSSRNDTEQSSFPDDSAVLHSSFAAAFQYACEQIVPGCSTASTWNEISVYASLLNPN